MNKPLVSIITPSYNQGQFIEETILSVKKQDYPNIEHIIIDGGSTDETLDIIKKYEGIYNMQYISERDNGMYEAINKGLKIAKGEILSYLNSDDLYFPYTIQCVVEIFKNMLDVEMIFGDVVRLFLEDNIKIIEIYPSVGSKYLLHIGGVNQPAMFWRRSVMDKIGLFDDSLNYAGDLDFFLRCAINCNIKKINEIFAIDRIHKNQLREIYRYEIDSEIDTIRQNLSKRHYQINKNFEYNVLRYYGHLKRRVNMLRFLFVYFCGTNFMKDWAFFLNFIRRKKILLSPTHELLIRLVPFIKNNYKRWHIRASYKELIFP